MVAAAALAIAEGQSIPGWAKANGLSPRTVQQWAKRPAFVAQVEEIRSRMLDQAIGILANGATNAAVQLRLLIEDSQSETIRLSAARALLADLLSVQSHAELRRELREIKARLDQQEKRRANSHRA